MTNFSIFIVLSLIFRIRNLWPCLVYFKIEEEQAAPRPIIPQSVQTDLCVVNDRFTVYQASDAAVCENQDGLMTPFTAIGQQKEVLQESNP